jgi:outer membrane protein, adhesin transport system
MSLFKDFPSRIARDFSPRGFQVAFARKLSSAGRLLSAALLATALAGCVTTASVPSSPFLSAVASLGPFQARSNTQNAAANASPSALNANAAAVDGGTTGSIPPPTAAPNPDRPQSAPNGLIGAAATVLAGPVPVAPPIPDRKGVYPQITSASSELTGTLATAKQPETAPGKDAPSSSGARAERGISLSDAVGAAVMSHPLMGAQAAKIIGSMADVRVAQGAMAPQLQVYAGSGGSYLGGYSNSPAPFSSVNIPASTRSDAGFTLRQLVYDFGAAKNDIARSKSLVDAERLRLADQAEDIALRTVNSYLNLLEQRELIALIDKVVADDNNFANLVKLSERQGNGTVADVSRIKSKVIEVEALRTDITTAYKTAQDEFFRLTKLESSRVHRPNSILSQVPGSLEVALQTAQQSNPSLLALSAAGVSLDQQLASQRAQRLPRVDLQGDGLVRHYVGSPPASQGIVDTRVMVMVSYKLLDGGVIAAQADRIREDRKANDFRALDECESIELNLRRFYQALSANRTKETAALQGTATAQKANSLYLEQFKAGKRTVFEILDSRMVVFTMQKNAVDGRYEQLRAAYGILRNMGRLVETAIRV